MRGVTVWVTLMLVSLGLAVSLVATGAGEAVFFSSLVALIGLYQALGARRTYLAIGPGWIYARTEAFGSGRWCRFTELNTVKRVTNPRGPDQLHLRASNGARFRFSLADSARPNPMRTELAMQLAACGVPIDPEIRKILANWTPDR